jgi:hypothetical protein
MGHHLEFNKPQLTEASRSFVEARAANAGHQGELFKLQDLAPKGNKYKANELAMQGEFIDPYVGKVYPKGQNVSEVVAMGMGQFSSAKEMLDLFRQDPEHFLYTLGALK